MADDKQTKLSIIIRTVDQATAKIKAINDRLDAATKPARDFKKALGDLYKKSGLEGLVGGFKDVGGAISDLIGKVAMIGGIAGVAVAGLFHIVNEFDELGDKAERLGVSVDFLAQMRYAAEKAGAPVESLDAGLQTFSENIGKLKANTGRLYSFLEKVSPALLKQVKGAKSNAEAFDLMAAAIAKLPDPARRAALTKAAFGGSDLAPLLAKGAKGVKELRDRYTELAGGSLQDAADKAGAVDDAMHDLHASTDGVKAALLSGLAPALKVIVDRLREWLTGHRAEIAEWAKNIGEKLPGAIQATVEWIGKAYDKVSKFIDQIGGLKTAALAIAAVLTGPLIAALVTLGAAMLETPGLAEVAALVAAAQALGIFDSSPDPGLAATMTKSPLNQVHGNLEIPGWAKRRPQVPEVLRPDVSSQAAIAALPGAFLTQPGGSPLDAKVTVDFKNMPRGVRAETDPKSTAPLSVNVGYQMLPGLM